MLGNVKKMCELAGVSRCGYYKWLKTIDRKPGDYDDYLLIKEIFDRGKAKWGWRTIQMKLQEDKILMNHKKIARIMNKYMLITKIRRKNPYKAIMKKSKEHRTFENKLNRNFKQDYPQRVFCTDITYLFFGNHRIAYLSAVKDIASREIVAWNLSLHLQMDIVLDTVGYMENTGNPFSLKDILIHSDQGFHYTSPEYISRIKRLEMAQSMSRKGNCIDNAPIESFFGHFKDEVDYKNCKTFEELKALTREYINYYNNERRQWNLKKMTPAAYKNYLLAAKG